MSSSGKSKNPGLRILWIPGKRKNHHKGTYSSVNKSQDYSGKQKPNEMWSLGGSKGQRDLLKSHDDDLGDLDVSSGSVLPAITAAGGAVASTSLDMAENGELAQKTPANDQSGDEYGDYNAAATLKLKDKKNQTDYDSIERLDDPELVGPHTDVSDGAVKRRLYKAARKQQEDKTDESEDSKAVNCLYYALMCCECNIS